MHTALSIGASDSTGGSGIQSDLKVFTVLGVYGMAVTTAVQARNTTDHVAEGAIPTRLIEQQLEALAADLQIDAFKTGALGTPATVNAVAQTIRRLALDRYVCDPVLHIHGGTGRGGEDNATVHAYRKELLPLAMAVTPNRVEAALLANMDESEVLTIAGAKRAAEKIARTGVRAVIIKGLSTGDRITDLFFDGHEFIEFPAKRLNTKNTYGAGGLFSAIITGMLAQQIELATAVDHARSFVSQAIEHHVKLGAGVRPVNVLALTPQ